MVCLLCGGGCGRACRSPLCDRLQPPSEQEKDERKARKAARKAAKKAAKKAAEKPLAEQAVEEKAAAEHFLSTQNIADAEEEKALAERGAPTPCTTSCCVFPAKAACTVGAVVVVTVNVALCSRGPS